MPTAMPRASSYHVAFEAALLLRIVQVPAEQRVNLTEKRDAREKVVAQVEKMFKGSIGLAQARKAGLRFYDGLMLQLRGLQAAVLQGQVQHRRGGESQPSVGAAFRPRRIRIGRSLMAGPRSWA